MNRIYLTSNLLIQLLSASNLFAQTKLDTHFGNDGIITTSIGENGAIGQSVLIQPDEKIIVGGYSSNKGLYYDFALVRYNADGSLDQSFGTEGKVMTDVGGFSDYGKALALQADGKILIAGSCTNGKNSDFALVRYNADGSLDLNFGKDGKVITAMGINNDYGKSIALQTDGKIIIAGGSDNGFNYDFALIRYNTDGSIDNWFGKNGKAITDVGGGNDNGESITIDANGKIVVAGYAFNEKDKDIALLRYNSNGILDESFNGNGKITIDIDGAYDAGNAVRIQVDGKIVVAGYSFNSYNYSFVLLKFDENGLPDNSFGLSGRITTSIGDEGATAKSLVLLSNGKIMVGGYTHNGSDYDFVLACYNADGTMDDTFNANGEITMPVDASNDYCNSVAIESNGIVLAGSSSKGSDETFTLARYILNEHTQACDASNRLENPIEIPQIVY